MGNLSQLNNAYLVCLTSNGIININLKREIILMKSNDSIGHIP